MPRHAKLKGGFANGTLFVHLELGESPLIQILLTAH